MRRDSSKSVTRPIWAEGPRLYSIPPMKALLLLLMVSVTAQADEVLTWNLQALDAVKATSTPPPVASRAFAMAHAAAVDALDAVSPTFTAYAYRGTADDLGGSPEAAVAQAAHDVLVWLFPARQGLLDAQLTASLAAIPPGTAKDKGIAAGQASAAVMLAVRAADDGTQPLPAPAPGPGVWVPTPPAFAPFLLPSWGQVRPFTMTSGSQFREGPPPPLNSPKYAKALSEVKALGQSTSTVRTADQTQIALFWADGAGTVTPPGHWNQIARAISQDQGLSLAANARLFALLNLAEADAAISAWDMKATYYFWRPITAIRTTSDAGWTPLIATPPFPSYTSGHSTFSDAAAKILAMYFGNDVFSFTTTSDAMPGVERSFRKFSDAAVEAGWSRIYGGIHYPFDDRTTEKPGRKLARQAFQTFIRPLSKQEIAAAAALRADVHKPAKPQER